MLKYNYKLTIKTTGQVYYYISDMVAELNYRVFKNRGLEVELVNII